VAALDVEVTTYIDAAPDRVRALMFDPRSDPRWMAAVKSVEPLGGDVRAGARVRRTGRFLGRTLRWTTEVTSVSDSQLDLQIVDGPMRGSVTYRIAPEGAGSRVTIRNIGEAPAFAPRWLLRPAMRRALTADLGRLRDALEHGR
jgi:uncharacterized membrane protein